MPMTRRSVALGLPLLAVSPASAAWPDRNITIIHGLAPGGGLDVTTRILADRFSQTFTVPVAVESRPGAATTAAAGHVAKTPANGDTIAVFPSTYGAAVVLRRTLDFRPIDDFTMIGQINEFPYVIATWHDHPIASIKDLVARARTAPQPLLYSTAGVGSAQHLLMTMLAASANIRLQHVPFKGGAPAVAELLAKRVDLCVDPPATFAGHFNYGSLRALAVSTRERSGLLPDIPAVSEAGFPDFDVRGWMGLVGPAGLPAPVVGRYQEALAKALKDQDVAQHFRTLGLEPRVSTAEQFRSLLAGDIERWRKAIEVGGIERI